LPELEEYSRTRAEDKMLKFKIADKSSSDPNRFSKSGVVRKFEAKAA
jgi:hypothetical protein